MSARPPVRLTAIVCNYNHAAYLPQALNAILASECVPDELIVVDDGSTDDSRAVIEDFAARDSRIRVIWHERNQGWHAATAHALDVATGNWIYSGAADDYVLPGFFGRALSLIERWPDAGVICGSIRKIAPDGRLVERDAMPNVAAPLFLSPPEYRDYICRSRMLWHSFAPATIFRREAIDAAGGFRAELGYWADTFVIRVAGLRWGMLYFPDSAVCFRVMPHSISQSGYRNAERRVQVIDAVTQHMRSPEFVHDFPPGYAEWWNRKAIMDLRSCFSDELDSCFAPVIDACLHPPADSSRAMRACLWLCRKTMSAAYRWLRYWTSHAKTAQLLRARRPSTETDPKPIRHADSLPMTQELRID